ncbi:type II toxin-antitoxin system RelE/ParE family toxin, partial [bacterium]|nr:type II toxin-antitoxin system RelE/ParE family toxin [bacterium]
ERVVQEDIPRLEASVRGHVKEAIEARLMTAPDLYGKPLRRSLQGYRKLRVGDYRVVFSIEGNTVKILVIAHRSRVYDKAEKRK